MATIAHRYRAKDLRALLRLVGHNTEHAAWVFLRPMFDSPQFFDPQGEPHSLDALLDGQFEPLGHQGDGLACGNPQSPWISRLLGLLSFQFPQVKDTPATMLVWSKGELLAVVGVTTPSNQAISLVEDVAHAVLRIHEQEATKQELSACRYVIRNWQTPCMVVKSNREILAATDSAMEILHAIVGRRPTRKDPIKFLPDSFVPAFRAGKMQISGKAHVEVSPLPHDADTVLPTYTVVLTSLSGDTGKTLSERARALTPTQKTIYTKIVEGFRNKEIADQLKISKNTVLHHVSAIFQKIGVMDRMQLLAQVAAENQQAPMDGLPVITGPRGFTEVSEEKAIKVADLPEADVMPDLPRRTARIRTEAK